MTGLMKLKTKTQINP